MTFEDYLSGLGRIMDEAIDANIGLESRIRALEEIHVDHRARIEALEATLVRLDPESNLLPLGPAQFQAIGKAPHDTIVSHSDRIVVSSAPPGYRAEVAYHRGTPAMLAAQQPFEVPLVYQWHQRLLNWETDSRKTIIAQQHATPDPGEPFRPPPFAIMDWKGQLIARVRTTPDEFGYGGYMDTVVADKTPEILDWRMEVVWSYKPELGRLTLVLNDREVLDYAGGTCYNDREPGFFKVGLYRPFYRDNPTEVGPSQSLSISHLDIQRSA